MQFRLVVGKLLQLKHRGLLVLLGFYEVCLCLCFALTLVDNVFAPAQASWPPCPPWLLRGLPLPLLCSHSC